MADVRVMSCSQGSISLSDVFDVLDLFDIVNFKENDKYDYLNRMTEISRVSLFLH